MAIDSERRQLRRELRLPGAVALGVGGTVGGGVYVLVGTAAGAAGPAALLAFPLAFLAALLIALPYAELACRYPLAGGGYAFVRAVFGADLGFLMGWGFWGAYVFVSGYVTLGFGGYLELLTGIPALVGAQGLIVVCLGINVRGVRVTGAVQSALVVIALSGLISFLAWGLPSVQSARLEPFAPEGAGGILSATLVAFLAFGGFDMVAAAGEEVDRPERNLPRAILITLGSVFVLYLLICLVAVGVLSSAALGSSSAPLADAAERFGGAEARGVVALTALITTAATANAVLVVTSRISFAMARDGLLPRALAGLSPRADAPVPALLTSAALMAAVATTGSISVLAAVGGSLYVLHFVVPLVALVALRRRCAGAPAFRTPAARLVLPLALAACATLIVASGPTGILGGLGWLAVGGLGYGFARRRVSAESWRGP